MRKIGFIKNSKLSKPSNLIFYIGMLVLPVTQFVIMYLVVNFNSFLLAFQDYADGGFKFRAITDIFGNFKRVFGNLVGDDVLLQAGKNSISYYFISLVFGTGLALMFSFYVYKRKFASGFFKLMLFMPSVVSGIVMVIIYKYICDRAVPQIVEGVFDVKFQGLIADLEYTWIAIVFYNLWVSFGSNILIYSGTMKDIPESVVEAAKLDGITPFKEFIYITLPSVYPMIVTFLTAGVIGIFTNQLNLFSFFGESVNNEYQTFGYYMYKNTYERNPFEYPYLATLGLVFSLIAIPITLLARRLLVKFGPSDD